VPHLSPLTEGGTTRTFVVECFWPEITEERVKEALSRVGPTSVPREGEDAVEPLGCILMPADGMVLFLFRGASEDLIRSRSEVAEVPFDRIVESIHIGFSGSQVATARSLLARRGAP
jgi:hypothetical protein